MPRFKISIQGKPIILKDGSKVKVISGATKSSERTRKRLEKQKKEETSKSIYKGAKQMAPTQIIVIMNLLPVFSSSLILLF